MRAGIDETLAQLPADFDRSRIVLPGSKRSNSGRSVLYLAAVDFDSVERNHFHGFFAVYDNVANGWLRRHNVVSEIIRAGGNGYIALTMKGRVVKKVPVKIVDAFQDRDLVVIQLELRKED